MVYSLPEVLSAERLQDEAEKREKEYDWLGAAEFYQKALSLTSQDPSKPGEICERQAYAFYKAAMQATNSDEFKERISRSITNYELADGHYGKLSEQRARARSLRCKAMIAFLGYWQASEPREKKRLLNESWRLTKESLEIFLERSDGPEYGRTFSQLSLGYLRCIIEWDYRAAERIATEVVECGEQAIRLLSSGADRFHLVAAYVDTASQLFWTSFFLSDPEEQYNYNQKAISYWNKATQISEEIAFPRLAQPGGGFFLGSGSGEALKSLQRALEYCRKGRDRLLIGGALEALAYHTSWKQVATEDPDLARHLLHEGLKYAEEAKRQYSPLLFTSPGYPQFYVESPSDYFYLELADREIDLEKKRELLVTAVEAGKDHLKLAEHSGFWITLWYAHLTVSKILASLARTEPRAEEKRRRLEEALWHGTEYVKICDQLAPNDYWDAAAGQNYLANIKSELAILVNDNENRKRLLQEAIQTKENCLRLTEKTKQFLEKTGSVSRVAWIAQRQSEYADLLISLYAITNDNEQLKKAAEAFEDAAETFQKPSLSTRMAECYWKAAQACGTLGEHLKASEKFVLASNNYKTSAENIPRLKEFYLDHASYMEAWSEIEKARHRHGRQDYEAAQESYEKASDLHKSTKQWSYLAFNYSALAQVEQAEDLSRMEQCAEAIQAFQEAARLFKDSKTILQLEEAKIEDAEIMKMVTSMIRGADLRQEYCAGRVVLEEAKLLDKKGEYYGGAEKYGEASETFAKIFSGLELEQGRKEIKLIMTLSRAWQMMARAEEETSPELYMEASRLFEEARELSPNEKSRSLALGHSRFCKALEAGARFSDSGDMSLHVSAVHHLESASKYFLRAGFQNASEYAEASKLLFDAYAYMDEANKEKDHDKKTKLFIFAEKVLQSSADGYLKAEQAGKREQVLRLLEKVKKERELAVSLTEVLHAPTIVPITSSFNAPAATGERAVGLGRFEDADVQVGVIAQKRSMNVGEELDLEIELVNAGKSSAQLVKIEEVVPAGFEIREKPEVYRVEDSSLSMKGKRLEPLKTDAVRLVLRPKVQGQFTLKPRIIYLDESGKYKSHQSEPVEVVVRELGISGWLKGR